MLNNTHMSKNILTKGRTHSLSISPCSQPPMLAAFIVFLRNNMEYISH